MSEQKRFIILIYGSGEEVAQLPEAERQAHMQQWENWIGQLTADGAFDGGQPLSPDAKTIRGQEAKVTDGFFVPESKYAIGGYIFVKAGSLDDAVTIAKGCPTFELAGNVEVREELPM